MRARGTVSSQPASQPANRQAQERAQTQVPARADERLGRRQQRGNSTAPPAWAQAPSPAPRSVLVNDGNKFLDMEAQRPHALSPRDFPSVPIDSVLTGQTGKNMGSDISNTAEEESVVSPDEAPHRAGSVVSMDDPDVRIAAQALGDLRAGMMFLSDSFDLC